MKLSPWVHFRVEEELGAALERVTARDGPGTLSLFQLWKQPQVGRAGLCPDFGQLGEFWSLFPMDQ